MSITTVNSAAGLIQALNAAQPGDTLQLAPGLYGAVSLSGLQFAQAVTLTSQDPARQASFEGLSVRGSAGLTFSSLEFRVSGGAAAYAVKVTESDRIHFDHDWTHGSLDGDPTNDGSGMLLRESTNIGVSNSTFEQLFTGLAHLNDARIDVSGNTFHDLRMDGVRGGGSSWVTITGNRFSDFHMIAGDHDDAIQFWTGNTYASAHDILIDGNVFLRGAGDVAQGIFLRDEVGGLPFRSVVIQNNLVLGGMYNGIAVNGAQGLTLSGNVVQGFQDMKSWVRIDNADTVTLTGNSANTFLLNAVTHLSDSGSTVLAQATDGGAAAYAAWQGDHLSIASTGQVLNGTAGDDTLVGGVGADTLNGGGGADLLTGGGGDDLYVGDKPRIVEAAGGGVDTVRTMASYTLPANVETLELTGTRAVNGQGNGQDNLIVGNSAANLLVGRGGADTLIGGGGSDTLAGGPGSDHLTGGAGADTFVFAVGDGVDVVGDFGAGGEHDAIDISAWLASGAHPLLVETADGVSITMGQDSILLPGAHLSGLHPTASGWVV